MSEAQVVAPEVVERRTPRVGDTVMIRHRIKTNKQGVASLEPCKGVVGTVKTVMMDGDVMVGDDLWAIKRSPDSKAVWATHAEKQRDLRD